MIRHARPKPYGSVMDTYDNSKKAAVEATVYLSGRVSPGAGFFSWSSAAAAAAPAWSVPGMFPASTVVDGCVENIPKQDKHRRVGRCLFPGIEQANSYKPGKTVTAAVCHKAAERGITMFLVTRWRDAPIRDEKAQTRVLVCVRKEPRQGECGVVSRLRGGAKQGMTRYAWSWAI